MTCSSAVWEHSPAPPFNDVNKQMTIYKRIPTPSVSAQMSQKSRSKSGFQRILRALTTHQVAQLNVGQVIEPCMKPEGYKRRRNLRTLSLSCSFVVGTLQVRSYHSSARWQNSDVTEGSKQRQKIFPDRKKIRRLISLTVSEFKDFRLKNPFQVIFLVVKLNSQTKLAKNPTPSA